jgi:hypothetical protein
MQDETTNAPPAGRYLYAITDTDAPLNGLPAGLGGREVETIDVGTVRVVASAIENKKLRPQRAHLAAHQGVLRAVAGATDALPVTFGVIADDEAALRRLIESNAETLRSQLDRVRGRVEMAVRVRFHTDNVFQLFVDHDEHLHAQRDALLKAGPHATRDQQIEVGQAFERALAEAREAATDAVRPHLERIAREITEHDPRTEFQAADIACLIERGQEQALESAVHDAAEALDDRFLIEIAGPWAPHSFVDLRLETA